MQHGMQLVSVHMESLDSPLLTPFNHPFTLEQVPTQEHGC